MSAKCIYCNKEEITGEFVRAPITTGIFKQQSWGVCFDCVKALRNKRDKIVAGRKK